MIEYLVDGVKYGISYQDLKDHYHELCYMTDEKFLENIPKALHLACAICWFKEVPTYVCLSDRGIIHELVHLIHIKEDTLPELRRIRDTFKEQLKLA
jgi:hypothetical protein